MIRSEWTVRARSLILAASGVFIALALITYKPSDIGFLSSDVQRPASNLGGAIGAWIGFIGRAGFGWASLVMPFLCWFWAWRLWKNQAVRLHVITLMLGCVSVMASLGTLLALRPLDEVTRAVLGGVIGHFFASTGTYYLGSLGTVLLACCAGLLAWLVVSAQPLRIPSGEMLRRLIARMGALFLPKPKESRVASPSVAAVRETSARKVDSQGPAAAREAKEAIPEANSSDPASVRIRPSATSRIKVPSHAGKREAPSGFKLPSLDIFATPPPVSERAIAEDLQANARVLEETLREFGVEASVVNIDRGPTVTRYELTPAPGVKMTKIVSLADDLALVLKAVSCHVVAPIPGKGRVGIDVPNLSATVVYLKEIIGSQEFQRSNSPLALPIGKDVSGKPIITDLRDCPHLLIAGATGSGKTVCLNSLLSGIISRAGPDQVRFLLIDPKMVELSLFNGIPHLIAPVVTDAKKAAGALYWALHEMERRYELFAKASVRNIDLYNKRFAAGMLKGQGRSSGEEDEDEGVLPYLVVVIDELADLMMVAAQDVESAITRLAQLSRAVGIHIILATQRPSVDVVTGVIKANIPGRLAFQVASKVDSRTILDMNGADKLVGRGDLLFLRPGTAKPIRAQGAFVTDPEIERLTQFLKEQAEPSYDERLLERQQKPHGTYIDSEKDELYEIAKQVVLDMGQASTSLLQRRLRLGYGRAARILDLMEQDGVVGPPQGSRPREILVKRELAEDRENVR